jgi:hypothetical protein
LISSHHPRAELSNPCLNSTCLDSRLEQLHKSYSVTGV